MKSANRKGASKDNPFRQFSMGRAKDEWAEGAIDRKEDEEIRERDKWGWAYSYVKGILI